MYLKFAAFIKQISSNFFDFGPAETYFGLLNAAVLFTQKSNQRKKNLKNKLVHRQGAFISDVKKFILSFLV